MVASPDPNDGRRRSSACRRSHRDITAQRSVEATAVAQERADRPLGRSDLCLGSRSRHRRMEHRKRATLWLLARRSPRAGQPRVVGHDPSRAGERVLERLEEHRQWSGELRHHTRDGRQLIVDSRQQLIQVGGRSLVLETNRDVTDRRRVEGERARLAAIVESSDDAIIGMDLDGTITAWNQAAERMYGYAAAEATGQSIRLVRSRRSTKRRVRRCSSASRAASTSSISRRFGAARTGPVFRRRCHCLRFETRRAGSSAQRRSHATSPSGSEPASTRPCSPKSVPSLPDRSSTKRR